ncbi:MAG: efflux RND transporter permease subunit [Bacteroidales bacterium]|nr:efflux RND transporter permease subunit [Bacteroidales bacterium]
MKSGAGFTTIFTMVILMVIGAALIPRLDIGIDPKPRQGKTLSITFNWPQTPAHVVEQNATSIIEGVAASVRGVERVESASHFGRGSVNVQIKRGADVDAVKFEISSALKQLRSQLPEGMSYPLLSGGEVVSDDAQAKKSTLLLTYRITNQASTSQLREYAKAYLEPLVAQIDDVDRIDINGGTDRYLEVTFDPLVLSHYGLTAADLREALVAYIGDNRIVGEVEQDGQRIAAWIASDAADMPIEMAPIANKGLRLNDLAQYRYRYQEPDSYFRINGLNTVYLNVYAQAGSNLINLSDRLQREIKTLGEARPGLMEMELTYDAAERQRAEMGKVVSRSLLSLLILLVLVLAVRRSWKYLGIVAITLAAALLISILVYWALDLRLHIFSLAGITVSLGLVIDASIVMIDHYGYYRDRTAFLSILAALLTTIGSLVLIFFMPEHIQADLEDFAWVVIINLTVALLVAFFFVPALVDALDFHPHQAKRPLRAKRRVQLWTRAYSAYIAFTQRHKWVYVALLVLAFGLPIFALPEDWQFPNRDKWERWLGGSMHLFAEKISERPAWAMSKEKVLHISGKLPLGGTPAQLNEKVLVIDEFLTRQEHIARWETRIDQRGANITVEFEPEAQTTGFPYLLESRVIGQLIDIGGADWATWGVSDRGFSNSLNLAHRFQSILITGYNYSRLCRIAEEMMADLGRNPRITDLAVLTPGYELQEDELYLTYQPERMASLDISPTRLHQAISEILSEQKVGELPSQHGEAPMEVRLRSSRINSFDFWQLQNTYLQIDSLQLRLGDFASVGRRAAKNIIERRDQEYVLKVAFNVVGSYTYTERVMKETVERWSARLPIGYRCEINTYGWREDTGQQYWMLAIVVAVVFLLCGILFESLTRPLVIISLIPVSMIGVFLTFWATGVEFGTGGFASMVLLCGIVVNSGIYILSEYDKIMKRNPCQPRIRAYARAYNHKIIAVLLTVASTVAGLIPFLFDTTDDQFWLSFAVGTIGGLLFSLLALVLFLPICLRLNPKKS